MYSNLLHGIGSIIYVIFLNKLNRYFEQQIKKFHIILFMAAKYMSK